MQVNLKEICGFLKLIPPPFSRHNLQCCGDFLRTIVMSVRPDSCTCASGSDRATLLTLANSMDTYSKAGSSISIKASLLLMTVIMDLLFLQFHLMPQTLHAIHVCTNCKKQMPTAPKCVTAWSRCATRSVHVHAFSSPL